MGCVACPGLATTSLGTLAATEPGQRFSVLSQPALPSAKAGAAAMLAVTRADRRMICVGERGIVLLSDDDGGTWRQAKVPTAVTLTAVQFVGARRGWAVGHLGVVLHSDDGGESWVKQLDGLRVAELALESAQRRATELSSEAAARALAFAKALQADGPDKPFLDLHFDDERTGYVVGAYNLAFRTDDGGKTWRPWMGCFDNPKGLHLYAMRRSGDSLYVAGEQGLLLKATAGSDRFEKVQSSPYKGTYFGLVVGKGGELVLFGLRGKAFWSNDGAASWQEIDTATTVSLSVGVSLSDGRLLLASQAGDLLLSDDGGRSFKRRPTRGSVPVTGIADTANRHLIAASLRGVQRLGPVDQGS